MMGLRFGNVAPAGELRFAAKPKCFVPNLGAWRRR